MKKIVILLITLIMMAGLTACTKADVNTIHAAGTNNPEKMHEDIAAEKIHHVTINGNARSILIRQSEEEQFSFYNGDWNKDHTYSIDCNQKDDTIDINIMMEYAKDNDVLGSVIIDVPKKEFDTFEINGDFGQVSLYTINSDVSIHAKKSRVSLDLSSDHLEHNITLEGSEENAFQGVSVYFDKIPENVKMECNLLQGGSINDPRSVLDGGGLECGSGEPVISINNTKEINIYIVE